MVPNTVARKTEIIRSLKVNLLVVVLESSRKGTWCLSRYYPIQKDSHRKWTLNYEVPFVVKKTFFDGALSLMTMDGEKFQLLLNSDTVKKYYI